jgi:AraC-like DNA-binding protein
MTAVASTHDKFAAGGADALLPALRLSFDGISGSREFDALRQRVGGFADIAPPKRGYDLERSRLDVRFWHFGDLIATSAQFAGHEQVRLQRAIRHDQIDHYRILLQTAGTLHAQVEGREIRVEPGQILVTDMSQPERGLASDGARVTLMIAREALEDVLPVPMALHGLIPQGPTAFLLSSFLPALAAQADGLRQSDAAAVARSAIQLVAAAIAPNAQTLDAARPAIVVSLLRQINRYIELHLTDATLSPDSICDFFRMSRASLYRLFEPLGGVASYVRERRLLRIHGLLESRTHKTLGRLAEEYGFSDTGHLSRTFRRMFGYNASDVVISAPNFALSTSAARSGPQGSMTDWLRGMLR